MIKKGKIFKRLLLLPVLCFAFMFFDIVNAEDAPSTVTIDSSKTSTSSKGYITVASSGAPLLAPVQYVNVGGSSVGAYCLDMNKIDYQGSTATLQKQSSAITDPGYIYLLTNGAASSDQSVYVTQMALWWYQDATKGTNNLNEAFKGENAKSIYKDDYNLYDRIASLAKGAINASKNATGSSSSSNSPITFSDKSDTKMKYNSDYSALVANIYVNAEPNDISNVSTSNVSGFTPTSNMIKVNGNIIRLEIPVSSIPQMTRSGSWTIRVTGQGNSSIVGYMYGLGDSSHQNLLVPIPTTGTSSGTYEVTFERTKLTFKKLDANGTRLGGAQLRIKKIGNDTVIHSWTSSSTADEVVYDLAPGSYQIEEISAPSGYVKAATTTFEVEEGKEKTVIITNTRENTTKPETPEPEYPDLIRISVIKKDEDGNYLGGAKMRLSCKTSGSTYEFTTVKSTSYPITSSTIIDGEECTLEEISAPSGYILNAQKVTKRVYLSSTNVFEMTNKQNRFPISKQDTTTGKELPGATLEIRNALGQIIDKWESTTEPHIVKGLADGVYTLHETIAPDGYVLASSITFTVKNGKVSEPIVMKNETTIVTFEKRAKETDELLKGAELVIRDSSGRTIYRWHSTDEAHIIKGLIVGKTYTLEEVTAPDGYDKAEPVTFTVKDSNQIQVVVMYDNLTMIDVPNTASFTSMMIYGTGILVLVIGILGTILYMKRRKNEQF